MSDSITFTCYYGTDKIYVKTVQEIVFYIIHKLISDRLSLNEKTFLIKDKNGRLMKVGSTIRKLGIQNNDILTIYKL